MPEVASVPLSQLTTLRTGGLPARMVEATTSDELVRTLREVWATGEPWLVVGGGSNLFVGDEPFEGTVIRVRTSGIDELPGSRPDTVRLRVQAGHDWDALAAETVARGLAGIEAMSGIPARSAPLPCRTSARTARRSCRPSSRSNCSTSPPASCRRSRHPIWGWDSARRC